MNKIKSSENIFPFLAGTKLGGANFFLKLQPKKMNLVQNIHTPLHKF